MILQKEWFATPLANQPEPCLGSQSKAVDLKAGKASQPNKPKVSIDLKARALPWSHCTLLGYYETPAEIMDE